VLISLDTTRRDHLSVYGYERDTTPHLARFAAGGVRFEQAYAPTSTTAPTHATLFTSLYPITHRVLKNGQVLIAAHRTLAERLNEQGYATAGFVSSFVLDARFGASQGFDHWDDEFQRETASVVDGQWEGAPFEVFDRRADATTERALAWLDELRGEGSPFFLFVHYFDPHQPYRPPAEFEVRFGSKEGAPNDLRSLVARYDAELAFTDHAVDRLLDAISTVERAANTLVVITADHGEGLMQHGHLGHGVHLYEEQVRVPLLLHWPGHLPAGRVIKGPVSLIDLAPTVLELMGVEVEEGTMQGHSLTGVLEGRSELDRERPIFLLRRHHEPGFEPGFVGDARESGHGWRSRRADRGRQRPLPQWNPGLYDGGRRFDVSGNDCWTEILVQPGELTPPISSSDLPRRRVPLVSDPAPWQPANFDSWVRTGAARHIR
jgi:arylsulfatase A-like enzyme